MNTKISEVENKIRNSSDLETTTVWNSKISEVENKISNHDKYIITPEYNKVTAENFTAILKQASLVTKTNFDKELTSFNRKITWDRTKYLEFQKKLNNLITKVYNFFLGRIYFTSNDGSQNAFVYQPTLNTLELKKGTDYVVGNQMEYIILNLSHYILLSYTA